MAGLRGGRRARAGTGAILLAGTLAGLAKRLRRSLVSIALDPFRRCRTRRPAPPAGHGELLKEIGHAESGEPLGLSFQDLERYSQFFRSVISKLPKDAQTCIRLDRFLKMYGNQHAYKNVRKGYAVREPEIRCFSLEDRAAERFDLSKITLRSNADVLFACLLLSLDQRPDDLESLTVGKVVELLPLGTGGICNPASFNYAMVALFGRQKQRDYFQLEQSSLAESFTEQANQSTRDMQFYKKWSDVKLSINSKYLKRA